MSSLADLPELIGFFSYSRDDDADSHGALSALCTRIQGELRGQLGRTAKTFRLWQDREAIASGTLRGGAWEDSPDDLRSAHRGWNSTSYRDSGIGFRLGRALLTP